MPATAAAGSRDGVPLLGRIAALVRPGVDLQAHFRVGHEPEAVTDELDQPGDGRARQEARRPAPEVQRLEGGPRAGTAPTSVERVGAEGELDAERTHEPLDSAPRAACGPTAEHDEVAVGAHGDAEGDVDVERDGGRGDRVGAERSGDDTRVCRIRNGGPIAGRRPACDGRRQRSLVGAASGSRVPTTRQPSGSTRRRRTSSTSVPRGATWPA